MFSGAAMLICNQRGVGSIPTRSTVFCNMDFFLYVCAMKNILLTLSIALSSLFVSGQIPQITSTQFQLNSNYIYNVLIYRPANTTGPLPTVIFIPGSGESTTNINDLYVHGPFKFIRDNGWRPDFQIIAIQPPNGGPAPWQFIDNALDSFSLNAAHRVNLNRFYLTGLSYGASALYNYMRFTPDAQFRFPKAVVPFSITIDAQCGDFNDNTDFLCGTDFRYSNVPSWGFAGSGDSHFGKMFRFHQRLQQAGYDAEWSTYFGGHCCWNNFYNPAYTEEIDGIEMNIYQWMLRYPLVGLPVTWGYFRFNKILQQLEWSTESEIDNDHFEVEESLDGKNWYTIGVVPAVGIAASYIFKL
jgi:hypothetical protein